MSRCGDLLRSVPSGGLALSETLLAVLPELGRLDRRQIAASVGVAPPESRQRSVPWQMHIRLPLLRQTLDF